MANSADSDQLASPTDLDLHCLSRQDISCSAREGLGSANEEDKYSFQIKGCAAG